MTLLEIAEPLGLGPGEIRTELDLVEAVSRGLPANAVDAVVHSGILTAAEAEELVLSRRALAARKQRGASLTAGESDRLTRAVRVTVLANEHFGDAQRAARWLRKPNRALNGALPLALLRTGEGARVVEETVLRLAHGIFA
jgi:putative toxin-antitoxin system antitoxin component (TIGR02293 family)